MIPVLIPGLCAALAVGCSSRFIAAVNDARLSHLVHARFRTGPNISTVETLRIRLATVVDRASELLDRATGATRARRRIDLDVLLLLESTVRRIRSGSSLRAALIAASGDCSDPDDRWLADSLQAGSPIRDTLDAWMLGGSSSRVLVGTALGMAAESGGSVSTVLDGVAESLRERLALDREVAALASQARASAMVLIVAPALFAVLMATIDPRVARVQFGSPLGWACCAVGVALDVAGALWMSRMIRRVR